jgi:pimeloyl-ACP methyl ester carboxylesterase
MLTMSYILSADATVYYEEYGTGEPLVLIPGLLGSVETHWRRFIPEYAKHFHTIAVDLRGHGRTNNPSRRLPLLQCADDLRVLLDTLQVEQALLCGYSFGGYVALAYTLRHSDKVHGLVMHGMKFYWNEQSVAAMAGGLDPEAVAATVPEWAAALEKDHLPGNGPDGWRDLMHAARPLLRSLTSDGIGEDDLTHLGCPALVTVCDGDEMVPRQEAERLTSALPAGRLHVFERCTQALQSMPKQPFVDVTTKFFLSCVSPDAG